MKSYRNVAPLLPPSVSVLPVRKLRYPTVPKKATLAYASCLSNSECRLLPRDVSSRREGLGEMVVDYS
jgi:hypothetical protein